MRHCIKCGSELDDCAAYCGNCGHKLLDDVKPNKENINKDRGNWADYLGRVGLAFSIVGLVLAPIIIFELLGLIFGIICVKKATCKGKCIISIVFSSISLFLGLIFLLRSIYYL